MRSRRHPTDQGAGPSRPVSPSSCRPPISPPGRRPPALRQAQPCRSSITGKRSDLHTRWGSRGKRRARMLSTTPYASSALRQRTTRSLPRSPSMRPTDPLQSRVPQRRPTRCDQRARCEMPNGSAPGRRDRRQPRCRPRARHPPPGCPGQCPRRRPVNRLRRPPREPLLGPSRVTQPLPLSRHRGGCPGRWSLDTRTFPMPPRRLPGVSRRSSLNGLRK